MGFFRKHSPWILTVMFMSIMSYASFLYLNYKRGEWVDDIRNETLEILIGKKSRLEKSLFSRIYYTKGVAAFVSLKPNITTEEYDRLASEFIQKDTIISTMALAKDCVISAIYPYNGHQAAIGLDLMEHPKRFEIVKKTIETKKTFVAGPVELVEGGLAFISYTPIFTNTIERNGEFWGLTDIVIYKEKLIKEAGLTPTEGRFEFALKGDDGKGENGQIFWGNDGVFQKDPVKISIELPNGHWILAAVPVRGWNAYYNQESVLRMVLLFSTIIISILMFIILKAFYRIRNDENEFRAIFNSMDTLLIEFNTDGDCLKVAPTDLGLLLLPMKQVIGKNIENLFDSKTANLFKQTVKNCIDSNEVVVIDYPLNIENKEHWFSARVSRKSGSTVLFNISDITDLKKVELKIKHSERRLKKLNSIKDLFFSIVAHDLRNPIGSFRNLSEVLLDDSIVKTPEEVEQIIRSMHQSSVGVIDLLENLLSWAQSQQESLITDIHEQSIFRLIERVFDTQESFATEKKITLKNEVLKTHRAYCDDNISLIILRNLISNALKFSYEGSQIIVSSFEEGEFLVIQVIDQGIGMETNRMKKLFTIDSTTVSYGTKNEKGSGLGLMLCKEFVELQGGKIWVKSVKDKGTTINFTIPLYNLQKA